MASIPNNNIVRSIAPKTIFSDLAIGNGLNSSSAFNQGDLLIFDTSTLLARIAASEGEAATFLGVSPVSVASGVPVGPYQGLATSSQVKQIVPGPVYGVIASLNLKVGDALAKGASVYADPSSGQQFVQASGTKPIGVYEGPSITGVSGTTVECLLGARYPNDTLKF